MSNGVEPGPLYGVGPWRRIGSDCGFDYEPGVLLPVRRGGFRQVAQALVSGMGVAGEVGGQYIVALNS